MQTSGGKVLKCDRHDLHCGTCLPGRRKNTREKNHHSWIRRPDFERALHCCNKKKVRQNDLQHRGSSLKFAFVTFEFWNSCTHFTLKLNLARTACSQAAT